jgi:hypothetical protein
MHPLFDNLKTLTFEELEKRNLEIHKRMQMYMRNRMNNPVIWDQLQQMQDAIIMEKQERVILMNQNLNLKEDPVVINTDPVEGDQVPAQTKKPSTTFNPIS